MFHCFGEARARFARRANPTSGADGRDRAPRDPLANVRGDCPRGETTVRTDRDSKNRPRQGAKPPGRGGHEAQGRAESNARADPRIRPGRRREVFRPSRTGRRRGGRPCGAFPFAPEPAVPPRSGTFDRACAADSGADSRTNLTRKTVGRRIRARRQMSICGAARRRGPAAFRGRAYGCPGIRRASPNTTHGGGRGALYVTEKNYNVHGRKTHAGLGLNAILRFSSGKLGTGENRTILPIVRVSMI